MSVVPSVNASSNRVLPSFFAAPASDAAAQRSVADPAETESNDSGTFSKVLEKSSRNKPEADLPSSQLENQQQVETKTAGDFAADRPTVNQPLQAEVLSGESLSLGNQVVRLSPSSKVDSVKNQHRQFGNAATALGSIADGDDESGVGSTLIDRVANAAAAINVTGLPNTVAVSNASDTTDLDEESQTESVEHGLLQRDPEDPNQDRSGLNSPDSLQAGHLSKADDFTVIGSKAAGLDEAASAKQTESLGQLRSQLETEFSVSPSKNRQEISLPRAIQNQGGFLRNQPIGSDATVNPTADDSAPKGLASQPQAVSEIGQAADTAPVHSANSFGSTTTRSLPQGLQASATDSQIDLSTSRSRAAAIQGQQNSTPLLQPEAGDPSEQLVQPTPVDRSVNLQATESAVSDADAVQSASVVAGAVNGKQVKTDPDADEVQTDSLDLNLIDSSSRPTTQAENDGRAQLEFPVKNHAATMPGGGSTDAAANSDSSFTKPTPVETEPAASSSIADQSPAKLPTDSYPMIDSDLDLLQQLLPRETTVSFGQSGESDSGSLRSSLDLPKQIAARAIGEAEVLDPGDSTRFRMKLDPPELGSVMIEMQKTAQGTTITVTAADPATQQLLQDSVQQLQQSSSDEASVFEDLAFDFSSGDQRGSSSGDGRKSQAEKIRIAGADAVKTESEAADHTSTELDFVA